MSHYVNRGYAVLKRVKDGWNLMTSFTFNNDQEKVVAYKDAHHAANGWRSTYPDAQIIVSEETVNKCWPVNNKDGFPNARSV